jgi:hypothetical protein
VVLKRRVAIQFLETGDGIGDEKVIGRKEIAVCSRPEKLPGIFTVLPPDSDCFHRGAGN